MLNYSPPQRHTPPSVFKWRAPPGEWHQGPNNPAAHQEREVHWASLSCSTLSTQARQPHHLVHYAGVLASASKLRALVVPPAPPEFTAHAKHSHREQPPTHRSRYRPWAELLKRTFQIDVERCECGGRFKLRALVIARICLATPKRLIAVTPSPYESLGQSRLDPQLY